MAYRNTLTRVQERAAILVADDAKPDRQIAAALHVDKRTLERWKQIPLFAQRVDEVRAQMAAALEAEGISNRQNRVKAQNERWDLLRRLIDERSRDPLLRGIPGGSTGLLVGEPVVIKVYGADQGEAGEPDVLVPTKRSEIVYKLVFDRSVLQELRELEKQVAQELGQWAPKTKTEVTGKDGGDIQVKGAFDYDAYNQLFLSLLRVEDPGPEGPGGYRSPQPLDPPGTHA